MTTLGTLPPTDVTNPLANETAPNMASYTALQTTTDSSMATAADTAPTNATNNANNVTCVDTATTTSASTYDGDPQ
jgi:hypothetical protein